jgi:RNA polymerase sigma-70 factor (ECF subfamily)
MVRVQGDDPAAFAELYGRHAGDALGIATEICRDDGMAEDVVQEGFFAIWRSRADYRPQLGTFKVWSMRIVHNRAVDAFRAISIRPPLQAGRPPTVPAPAVDTDHPLSDAIAASERTRLLVALGHLPSPQAEVLILAFYRDLSHTEIAVRLGLPSGTVKGRVRSGLEKLRYELLFVDPLNGGE